MRILNVLPLLCLSSFAVDKVSCAINWGVDQEQVKKVSFDRFIDLSCFFTTDAKHMEFYYGDVKVASGLGGFFKASFPQLDSLTLGQGCEKLMLEAGEDVKPGSKIDFTKPESHLLNSLASCIFLNILEFKEGQSCSRSFYKEFTADMAERNVFGKLDKVSNVNQYLIDKAFFSWEVAYRHIFYSFFNSIRSKLDRDSRYALLDIMEEAFDSYESKTDETLNLAERAEYEHLTGAVAGSREPLYFYDYHFLSLLEPVMEETLSEGYVEYKERVRVKASKELETAREIAEKNKFDEQKALEEVQKIQEALQKAQEAAELAAQKAAESRNDVDKALAESQKASQAATKTANAFTQFKQNESRYNR
jgi:hypothetical protein